MDFTTSKTYANLLTAFSGESQARNKYTYYASKARQEGYEQIAAIFEETANNEKEHGKIWYKYLHGNQIPDTLSNLKDGVEGEHYEYAHMYKTFAQQAKEEGYQEIAALFEMVGKIEHEHEKRYATLASNLEKGIVFARDGSVVWLCRNCGYLHIGGKAPEICPVCKHPQSFFEIKAENY